MAAVRRMALVLTAALVVALPVALIWLGQQRPAPDRSAVAVATYTVAADTTTWVCAPAPTLPTATAGQDIDYDPELGTGDGILRSEARLTAVGVGSAPEVSFGSLSDGTSAAPTHGLLAIATASDTTSAVQAVVSATGDDVPLVGGLSLARADNGDLRGLAASTCQRPMTSAVLVGGATAPGSSTQLVLSNPTATVATATVTGWTETGPLPDVSPIVVPPAQVRVVLLETLSLAERIAVRIDVSGGALVPFLQHSSLDGLVAAGTDVIGPAADPATTVTFGAIDIGTDDGTDAFLRMVNPNEGPAAFAVSLLSTDGPQPLEGAQDVVIEAGSVLDISLAGVHEGSYGVRVVSDLPVTGAIGLSHTGVPSEVDPDVPPVDLAWLPADTAVTRAALPLPTDLVDSTAVSLTNPSGTSADALVVAYDADGTVIEEQTITVVAGGTAPVPVSGQAVLLEITGNVVLASAVLTAQVHDGVLISALTQAADQFSAQTISVRVSN